MDFEVGQLWTRGKGIWETGKRIVDVDRRGSVTFFKTEDKHGGDAAWISADLLAAWVEDSGSSLADQPDRKRIETMTQPTDLDAMAVCAIRYAIGRQSYIVGDAARWARDYGAKSGWVRGVVIRDLQEAAEREDRGLKGALGGEMDAKVWRAVLAELQALEPVT